jgi:hypothetical protein
MRGCTLLVRLLMIALLSSSAFATAALPAPSCPATNTSREWSAACFDTAATGRQVKKEHRSKVVFNRKGIAVIIITAPPELVAVNRRGAVINLSQAHLAGFDFEPSDASITRFGYFAGNGSKKNAFKCGYYRQPRFEVIAAPVYDQCDTFSKGTALVCIGCVDHCPHGDCHETDFVGGEGLVINEKNEILRRFALPTMPLCEDSKDKGNGEKPCRPRPPDPFAEDQARQTE